MKEMKKLLCMVLCFVMLVGYLPAGALAADAEPAVTESVTEQTIPAAAVESEAGEEETTPPVTAETTAAVPAQTTATAPSLEDLLRGAENSVSPLGETSAVSYLDAAIFFADLHAGRISPRYQLDYKKETLQSVLGAAAVPGMEFSTVTSVGDLFAENGITDTGAPDSTHLTPEEADKDILSGYIREILGNHVIVNYAWSDHDRTSDIENITGLLYGDNGTALTTTDDENYYIYTISMSDMSTSGRYGVASTFDASKLADFTETMNRLDPTKPVFIASHQPLHYKRGDNQHAYDWFQVINAAAQNRDIILLWGHNHNYDEARFYDYPVGSAMTVQNGENNTVEVENIQFTQLAAGYLSPTTAGTYTRTGTVLVTKLTHDDIICTTYNKDGVYAGTANKPGLVERKISRAHKTAPASGTVTAAGVTFTAPGLTETGTTVTDVTETNDLSQLFYDYTVLEVTAGAYAGGEVSYSVALDSDMNTENLALYYLDGAQQIPMEFRLVSGEDGVSYLEYTAAVDGLFAYGEGRVPEGYALTHITIDNVPDRYFVGTDLDLSDAVVTLTYTKDGADNINRHLAAQSWDGYFTGYDCNTAGVQTVTFTYEGLKKTFQVEFCPKVITWPAEGEAQVTIAHEILGLAFDKVQNNTDAAFVTAAMAGKLTGYVAYDITLKGYTDGQQVTVTLPVPADTVDAKVFYVPENGEPVDMNAQISADGESATFVTDHFSTYVVGDSYELVVDDPVQDSFEDYETTVTGEAEVYYVLDTDGLLDKGAQYLIVNSGTASNSNRYALNNSLSRTSVHISSGNVAGFSGTVTYIKAFEADATAAAAEWTVGGSEGAYTFCNGDSYLRNRNGSLRTGTADTATAWVWDMANSQLSNGRYYLRYSGSRFSLNTASNSVYFYKRVEVETTTTETVLGGTYSVVGDPAVVLNNDLTAGDTAKLHATVIFKEHSSDMMKIDPNCTLTYAEVENGDPKNVITLEGDTVTFTGNVGTALVKVTATGYHNSDSTKPYTVTNYIQVTAKLPEYSVAITTHDDTRLKTGDTLDLEAAALTNDKPNGGTITWSSSDETVATVNTDGTVTALKAGTVTVTATYVSPAGTRTATIDLVVEDYIYTLWIKEAQEQLKIGNSLNLEALCNRDGETMEGQSVAWSSSDETIAGVDENGTVTGVREGTVTVTATWTDPAGVSHEATKTITVVEHIWRLSLERPVLDNEGNFVYATDENGEYLLDDEGNYYYATEEVTAPIVIKEVLPGQTYDNVWAQIFRDGVNIGSLNEEELPNLTFISSNPGIATVDDKTGVVTFIGGKSTAAITAIYTYSEGKSVMDTVMFSVSPDEYYTPDDGTDDFREYPNEGAIRFDKTATAVGNFSQTGIAQVELSMTGVPYGRGVDVVVVIDTSSSMRYNAAGQQVGYDNSASRYAIMKQSLRDMLNTFGGTDSNGDRADVDLAIVDFNGYSSSTTSANSANFINGSDMHNHTSTNRTNANKARVYTGDGKGSYILDTTLGANHFENTGAEEFDETRINQIIGYFTTGSSGTNYDFAFQSAYQLLAAKKAANEKAGVSRDQYVIFMSDGAPFRYNGFTTNTGDGRNEMDTVLGANYTDSAALRQAYTWMPEPVAAMYNPANGMHLHRMAEAIKGVPGHDYLVVDATATTYKTEDGTDTGSYLKPYEGLGAKIYAIGFCLTDDVSSGNSNDKVLQATSMEIIRGLSSGAGYYWENVTDKDQLSGAFDIIANSIVNAAKDVRVQDIMGDEFTMVFDAPNAGAKEGLAGSGFEGNNPFYIEVKDYTLVPVDANGNTVAADSKEIADFIRGSYQSLLKLYVTRDGDGYKAASNSAGTAFAQPAFTSNPIGNKFYWTTQADKSDCGISVTVGNTTYYFVTQGIRNDADGFVASQWFNLGSGAYVSGKPSVEYVYTLVADGELQSGGTYYVKNADNTYSVAENVQNGGVYFTRTESTLCNDLVIATPYFTYEAAQKRLVWTTEKLATSELTMTYFLYLDDSGGFAGSEAEIEAGTYPTNKEAYLFYTNFNGKECEQEFPVPQMTWNGAQVSYVFYLVNEHGQPVNRAGTVIPFSEAVYVTDVHTYSVVWNRLEQAAGLEAVRLAEELVPDVYRLYDPDAAYRIHVYEDEHQVHLNNHFSIEGSAPENTTYVFNTKADLEKYKTPGVHIADDGLQATDSNNRNYLCKDYNVTGTYTMTEYEDGSFSYTLNNDVTYVGDQIQWTPGPDDSYAGGHKIGDNVYYVDGEGKIYTIVSKKGAVEVHAGFDFSNTTVAFAVVWVPELKDDTVVLDFGLDVVVNVIANDTLAAGVVGVRSVNNAPNYDKNIDSYHGSNFQNTINIQQNGQILGTAMVENQNSVRFTLDKQNGMQFTDPAVFYYEAAVNERTEGDELKTYNMYSSVTVIPATSVYYEDEYVTLKTYNRSFTEAPDVTEETFSEGKYYIKGEDAYRKATEFNPDNTYYTAGGYVAENGWKVNSAHTTAVQATDRPGAGLIGDGYDADNIYGYDPAYSTCSTYSMGSAAMTQVINGNNYATAEFSFCGTGFDVISMTGDTTGTIVVQVDGEKKVNYVVDTYYGYRYDADLEVDTNGDGVNDSVGGWVVDEDAAASLYQVPVIKVTDLPYGKYTVTITASHAPIFDHEQYDGSRYDFYLDAIRIYDPIGVDKVVDDNGTPGDSQDDTTVGDVYSADSELAPRYYELRNLLIGADKMKRLPFGIPECGIVFIDGNANVSLETAFADYRNYGPNNELYLAPGQAVAFNLDAFADAPSGYEIDQVHVAYKTLGNGASSSAKIQIYEVAPNVPIPDPVPVNTATDMYFNISHLDNKTVVIRNAGEDGDSIVSITNIKVTYLSMQTVEDARASLNKYLNRLEKMNLRSDLYIQSYWLSYIAARDTAVAAVKNENVTLNTLADAYFGLKVAYLDLKYAQTQAASQAQTAGIFSITRETAEMVLQSLLPKDEDEPEAVNPDVTEPQATEPETTEPQATEPETTEPQATEPETADPEPTVPQQTEPDNIRRASKRIDKLIPREGKAKPILPTRAEKHMVELETAEPAPEPQHQESDIQNVLQKTVSYIRSVLNSWF